jgi:hypothetical protein
VNRLPEAILLAHWPWDPAKLSSWRKRLRFLTLLVPAWARNRIWAVQEEKAREAGDASREAQGAASAAARERS